MTAPGPSRGGFGGGRAGGGGVGGAIRRLIQLVLDKAAAKRTEEDAKKTLKGIEGGFGSLGRSVANLGKGILTALGLRALIRIGMNWIRMAAEAERVWRNLAGTVEAAGVKFNEIEADVRGLAEAFQDVTIHDGEDFAGALTRMISLTGDVSASLNNMGMVANVASQFFGGDLGGAVELVSKVMNGNLTLLQRMGIRVKTAQEGLEVLARRSFGAAERAANTFSGRVARLNNFMGDLREELGDVVTGSGEVAGALEIVTDAVRDMIRWVKENKDELRVWVTEGVNFAIEGIKTLIGLWRTYMQMRGKLSLTEGTQQFKPGKDVKTLEGQIAVLEKQRMDAEHRLRQALLVQRSKELEEVPSKLEELRQAELVRLGEDVQESTDLLNDILANIRTAEQAIDDLKAGKGKKTPGLFNAPQTGKNVGTEGASDKDKIKTGIAETTAAQDVMRQFAEQMNAAATMSRALGDEFNFTEAETAALRQAIEGLALAGVDASDNFMVRFRDRLKEITFEEDAAAQVSADLVDTLIGVQTQSALQGDAFDSLSAQANAYQAAIDALTKEGYDASDPAMRAYMQRLREIGMAQEMQRHQMEQSIDVAQVFGEAIGAAMGAGIGPFAAAKAKQNLVEAAELGVRAIVAALNPFTAWQAPILATSAAKHVAIAGAWGALAGSMGGGGSSASAASSSLSGGRSASTDSSTRAQPAPPDVNIFLDGPGFDAMNPRVQRVVLGAVKEAREVWGEQSNVRLIQRPGH
jgi:hypothetical protein